MRGFQIFVACFSLMVSLQSLAQNQMGPSDSIGSVNYNFSGSSTEGIKDQFTASAGAPPYKTNDWIFTSLLNYQNLNLQRAAFTNVNHLNYEGLSISANAIGKERG